MRSYLIGAGAAIIVIVLWHGVQYIRRDLASDEATNADAVGEQTRVIEGGVGDRSADSASFAGLEWSKDPERTARFRGIAAEAPLITDLFKSEGRKWAQTRLALEDPLQKEREEERCKEAFGSVVEKDREVCTLTLGLVAKRLGDGAAEVMYTGAEIDEKESDACGALAGCLARERLGLTLPMPGDADDEVAIRQKILVRPTPEQMSDPAHLTKMSEAVREDLRLAREAGMDSSADEELQYRFLMTERILTHLDHRLEVVRGGSADP